MSKHIVRENKICQNCGRFVAENFCPQCGQENTEVRHSFIYLLKHFVSDLLHYDSSFWSTIKLLLFSPATLSKEYISGKRRSYVDPIKLYIFISFFTFFIPGILPYKSVQKHDILKVNVENKIFSVSDKDKVTGKTTEYAIHNNAELDSIAKIKNISFTEYYLAKFVLKGIDSNNADKQKRMNEFIMHNLSKVLFIYMPIFAFWLWLFHNKKKFLYFDSGIFTLHYFSFLLLIITILNILNTAFEWLSPYTIFSAILQTIVLLYSIYYFFKAHRLFYGEKRLKSNMKSLVILLIDLILIIVILLLFATLALFAA